MIQYILFLAFLTTAPLCLSATTSANKKHHVIRAKGSSIDKNTDIMDSRFILQNDPSNGVVAGVSLRSSWWSRPHEYEWAAQFANSKYLALDAGCGISHPFKWYLGQTCRAVWACDLDSRIIDQEEMLKETNLDLGEKAYTIAKKFFSQCKTIHCTQASLTHLPDSLPLFDRIFCISVLEHMSSADRKLALKEFARKLSSQGLVIITVDYPSIRPETLFQEALECGLVPAGSIILETPPKEALSSAGLYIYRCVLKAKK